MHHGHSCHGGERGASGCRRSHTNRNLQGLSLHYGRINQGLIGICGGGGIFGNLRASRVVIVTLDENLPPRWREFLAPFDIDATHWTDIGKHGDPDEFIFDYACAHQAIILTQDLDFTRMLALQGARLPSVIQLRVECPTPEVVGNAVLSVLKNHRHQLEAGCLITLDANRHRLRLLPLH